jgi:protein Mpv17
MMNFRSAFSRTFKSVRGFSNQVKEGAQSTSLWANYNRLLVEKPVLTKSITSGVIAFVADVACQKIMAAKKEGVEGAEESEIDWKRTAKFTIINTVLVGPLLHFWYGTLVAKIPGNSVISTVYRVACDQLIFAPFCIIPAFFAFAQILDGTPERIPDKLRADWATTMVANFSLWVPAQLINFKLVPAPFQVLFANMVGLLWSVYLSEVTAKALPTEAGAAAAEEGGSDAK